MRRWMVSACFVSLCLLGAAAGPVTAYPLVESYNDLDDWRGGTWFATQVALRYVPVQSYDLARVEFFTGGDKTGITIALRPDAGNSPSTTILASGTYDSSGRGSWLGATFGSPHPVTAGTVYWVTWYNTDDLLSPYSYGTARTVRWGNSGDPDDYPVLFESYGFKTRFYGRADAPEPGTVFLLASGLIGLSGAMRRRPS